MKKAINANPEVNRELVDKFVAMKDVLSISCVVGDAQERNYVMHSSIKIRTADRAFIGTALTVRLTPGYLVDPLDIFKVVNPGDVVVIDALGESETSIWGGLMSGLAMKAGIVGAVIDGSQRDTDESRLIGLPVASRSVSPRASHSAYTGSFESIEVNGVVSCGGVTVKPGDLIVGDEIGICVVPSESMEAVYPLAREQADKEEATRQLIAQGYTVDELLEKFGRI